MTVVRQKKGIDPATDQKKGKRESHVGGRNELDGSSGLERAQGILLAEVE